MIYAIVAVLSMTQMPQTVKARSSSTSDIGDGTFFNPNIYSDVPDMDMIRVGENYYMVSTTMHMSPGCPILKSTDLVNWETVNYVFDRLDDSDAANLINGRNMYGAGQWAVITIAPCFGMMPMMAHAILYMATTPYSMLSSMMICQGLRMAADVALCLKVI